MLAGVDGEVDPVKDLDRAKALPDAPQLDDDFPTRLGALRPHRGRGQSPLDVQCRRGRGSKYA